MNRTLLARLVAVVGVFSAALSGAQGAEPIDADIGALSFIAGSWEGELFGGHGREHWMGPQGGAMVGSFILTWPENDRRLYELLLIEQEGPHVVMVFRHFNPGMELWEAEKDAPLRFVLTEAAERRAVFRSPDVSQQPALLAFEVSEDDETLTVTVASLAPDGSIAESFQVEYGRVADRPAD